MSEIAPVTPAKTKLPVEAHQSTERDGGKRPPRQPRKPKSDDELV